MADCTDISGSDGAVNFLQFNCSIWGQTGDDWGSGWEAWNRVRGIIAGNRIAGFETPGAFLTTLFPYLLSIAGLILFIMLIMGAMEVMFGAANPKSAESGKNRITHALVGFGIIFSLYWIGQILQILFGLQLGFGG